MCVCVCVRALFFLVQRDSLDGLCADTLNQLAPEPLVRSAPSACISTTCVRTNTQAHASLSKLPYHTAGVFSTTQIMLYSVGPPTPSYILIHRQIMKASLPRAGREFQCFEEIRNLGSIHTRNRLRQIDPLILSVSCL